MKIRHIFLIVMASFVVGSFFVTAPATNAKTETFFVAANGSDSWLGWPAKFCSCLFSRTMPKIQTVLLIRK